MLPKYISLTMRGTLLILASLACYGLRVQTSAHLSESSAPTKDFRSSEQISATSSQSRAFALLLLACNRALAFNPPGLVMRSSLASSSRCRPPMNCATDSQNELSEDWREVRARLVAMERGDETVNVSYVYESPLIEKAAILLDAHNPDFPISEFYKSVVLLIEAEEKDSKMGLILNRPTKFRVKGFPLWYGGPVNHGEMFSGDDSDKLGESLQILCLHTLDNDIAKAKSFAVMPGIWGCSIFEAEELVEQGVAPSKDNFRAIAGYAGWNPEQLEAEVDDGLWAIASANSATILREFLQKQPPSTLPQMAGLEIWETLMTSIGRSDEVESSRSTQGDPWIQQWITTHLFPPARSDDK
mmetsp:Transcript_60369/g.107532  ORF Transcript_60369/g.107532 Transcript_60369/m.107532 type:complete len:357 (-) Transcript_60369:390-1460(-)